MELIDEISDLLQTHTNRDKVVSLTCYVLKLWGSTAQNKSLMNASAKIAAARACLRLFDDAPLLKNMMKYGLGKQEGPQWGAVGVTHSLFSLTYLQAEKLIFLIDSGIITVNEDFDYSIRTAHKLFWSLSSFVGLLRSIRALHHTTKLRTKCASARFTQASLTSTKLFLDAVHAVSWLPRGWLWGGMLSARQASAVATAAAVMGLVVHYHGKVLA